MYTIYADGELLHSPHLFQEGCGVFSPKLTVELNKAGSLDFTIPPNNLLYDKIQKLKSLIVVYQNGEEIFRGRVLNDEKDFYKQKKTYCEGELAFLLDSIQRPYTYSGDVEGLFEQLITNHNAKVDSDKKFTVGNVTVSGDVDSASNDYPNTFDEITNKIINVVGGHLVIRLSGSTRYIDLIADSEEDGTVNTTSQTIEFGVNLLDISEHITAENIYTVLIPLGATLKDEEGNSTDEKLTIADINSGKDYVEDTSAIELFGRIESKAEWNEVEDASELKELAEELLSKNIEMAVSLTLKAVDLNLLDVNVEAIHLGDWVNVISIPHGLNRKFQCTKITYDLESPDKNEYSFGYSFNSLTEQQVSSNKAVSGSISTIITTAKSVSSSVSKANQAVAEIETVISTMPTEYVQTTVFEAYKTDINAKFENYTLDVEFQALVERVAALEGGTT